MALIKIKRSPGTSAPTGLVPGEMAVTYGAGESGNGGGRLYLGTGDPDANTGLAEFIDVVGGKYFADLADHTPGVLTANSALIADSDKKLDELRVDSIIINGDTISSTGNLNLVASDDGDANTSGSIVINGVTFAAGSQTSESLSANTATFNNITISQDTITHAGGNATPFEIVSQSNIVDVNGAVITGVATPTANTHATNKVYVDSLVANTTYTFADGAGDTDASVFSGTFTFKGANQATGAEAYANGVDIATNIADNSMTFTLNTTGVSANTYGSASAVPTITVDSRGRITSVTEAAIETSFDISDGVNTDTFDNGQTLVFTGGTGVTTTVANNQITFAIGQPVGTTDNVTFNDVTVSGNLYSNDITAASVTIYGDLTVVGNTTTVNTEEINLADNTILLNSNQDSGTAPTVDAGIEINRGSANNVSFLWDETNDQWTTNGQKLEAVIDGGTF